MPWDSEANRGEGDWTRNTDTTPAWERSDSTLLPTNAAVGREWSKTIQDYGKADERSDMPTPTPEELITNDGSGYAQRTKGAKSFGQRFADHATESLDPRFNPVAPVSNLGLLKNIQEQRFESLAESYRNEGLDLTPLKLPGEMREEYDLRQQYIGISNRFPDADADQIMEVYSQEQLENQALQEALSSSPDQETRNLAFGVVMERMNVTDPDTVQRIGQLADEKAKAGIDLVVALLEATDEVLHG